MLLHSLESIIFINTWFCFYIVVGLFYFTLVFGPMDLNWINVPWVGALVRETSEKAKEQPLGPISTASLVEGCLWMD